MFDGEMKERRRLRHATSVMLACWALLATVGVIALAISEANDHQALNHSTIALERSIAAIQDVRHTVKAVELSELRSCHRLNIFRADTNHNRLKDWQFDQLFIRLLKAGLKHQTSTVHRSSAQIRNTKLFIASLQDAANAKSWIPLTDCITVVSSNAQPPAPIPFGKQLPGRNALVLGPRN